MRIRREKRIRLSEGLYRKLLESHNRRVRHSAFRGIMGAYGRYKNTLGSSLSPWRAERTTPDGPGHPARRTGSRRFAEAKWRTSGWLPARAQKGNSNRLARVRRSWPRPRRLHALARRSLTPVNESQCQT